MEWGVPKVGGASLRGPAALSLRDFFLARSDFHILSAALVANSRVNSKGLTPTSRKTSHLFTWHLGTGGGPKLWRVSEPDRWPRHARFSASFRKRFFEVARVSMRSSANSPEPQ